MKRFLTFALTAIIMLLSACPEISAQSKIDKLIEDLESKPDVETTYTEHRTRTKKKLYKISRVLTFTNQAYYQKAQKAFEAERSNSISAVKTASGYMYKFSDKNGSCSYTLTAGKAPSMGKNKGVTPYTLVMTWKSRGADDNEPDDTADITNPLIINSDSELDFAALEERLRQLDDINLEALEGLGSNGELNIEQFKSLKHDKSKKSHSKSKKICNSTTTITIN